ncbi:unnamed protein product [Kuraishia capsulata CBS 1993]|uniref:Uncharacterized protein n=1 Tax=Kuraishia capsulata CBS 1993 TaxID=1382522 RepID=W6MGB2_9ASCO|nr:uncharacterized protein KUCA_T00001056001 [Kuraishia capsulata CBS 1993]CDK25089.1 unnamed protein product [Kuraishia capsulata CBS 1993]
MVSLNLTGSNGSRMNHKSLVRSQVKHSTIKRLGQLGIKAKRPILPSEAEYLKELSKSGKLRKELIDQQEPLEKINYNVKLFDLPLFDTGRDEETILVAIRSILLSQYETDFPVGKGGISNKTKEKIEVKRAAYPRIVVLYQLYSVFINNHTFVDQQVEKLVRHGRLKRVTIKINGVDNQVLIESDSYFGLLDKIGASEEANFRRFLEENKGLSVVSQMDAKRYNLDTMKLIGFGLLTFINEDYYLNVPNSGSFLKLVHESIKFIDKQLSKMKYKEELQSSLETKWKNKNQNWIKFGGLSLDFVLSYCLGYGLLEVFNTPMGPGWKKTGKKF